MPSKISVNLPKHFHSFTHLLLPANPGQTNKKDQLLTHLISHYYSNQSVGKASPLLRALVCTQTTVSVTFRFSSGSSCSVQQPFRRLCHANELYELCCAVAEQHCFPSWWKKVCNVNVICLYLPCRVTLPQNTFGWRLQTVQKFRDAFECLLKWHQVQTTTHSQGKVSTHLSHYNNSIWALSYTEINV